MKNKLRKTIRQTCLDYANIPNLGSDAVARYLTLANFLDSKECCSINTAFELASSYHSRHNENRYYDLMKMIRNLKNCKCKCENGK